MLLRRFKFEHWHIGSEIIAPDTYKNLSRVFNVDSDMFFSQLFFVSKTVESNYASYFLNLYRTKKQKHNQFVQDCDFSDLKVFGFLAGNMPDNIQIQSANSSVVRYFQLFDLKQNQEFFCNRGTSGIEGSTSTSIGAAVKSQKPVLLVSGDLSFFYDSNGLWNNYIPNNFKIVLINNGGGSIFKIIPGPDTSASFDTFFKAEHKLNAKNLAEMYSFGYTRVDREKDLPLAFERFIKNNKQAQILEINTSKFENEKILEDYWNYLAV